VLMSACHFIVSEVLDKQPAPEMGQFCSVKQHFVPIWPERFNQGLGYFRKESERLNSNFAQTVQRAHCFFEILLLGGPTSNIRTPDVVMMPTLVKII
jgi:hypothetical protein